MSRGKDGKVVVSFEVHNEMDFREQIARRIPFFRVLEPTKYRSYLLDRCGKVAGKNG